LSSVISISQPVVSCCVAGSLCVVPSVCTVESRYRLGCSNRVVSQPAGCGCQPASLQKKLQQLLLLVVHCFWCRAVAWCAVLCYAVLCLQLLARQLAAGCFCLCCCCSGCAVAWYQGGPQQHLDTLASNTSTPHSVVWLQQQQLAVITVWAISFKHSARVVACIVHMRCMVLGAFVVQL